MTARYVVGDVLATLATLEPDSVDLVLTSPPFLALRSYLPAGHPDKMREIGSEPTPAAFIDVLLDVVEACARVLAPHGSLVFELGDTYAGGGQGPDPGKYQAKDDCVTFHATTGPGWPLDKSLCGIPQLFMLSLAYGRNMLRPERSTPRWRVRNVVAWCRPNPPVGALADKYRPATSYLTVACKSRSRYFDLDAVRTEPYGAPPLDWWNIPTQPYPGAHYATWPQQLCVTPIKSMCPQRVCTVCGQPSRRIVEKTPEYAAARAAVAAREPGTRTRQSDALGKNLGLGGGAASLISNRKVDATPVTVGWSDCGHNQWRTGTVLDPFAGSGTTLQVATGHGRTAIGIDLDPRNAQLAVDRVGPLMLTVETLKEVEA